MELLLPRWYVRPYQAAVPLLVSYSTAPCVRLCGIHVHLSIFASYTCKHTYMVTRHPPRCSGDFSQCKQTKYNMALPGLLERVIAQQLASDLNDMEKTVAAAPGMYGRIWYGQGLAFDEAYQILQDRHTCNCLHTHT